jgi:hypothetical protein
MIKKPALAVGQIWHGRSKPQYAISARRILAIEGTCVTWEPVGESGAKGCSTVGVQTFRNWAISKRSR